MQECEEDEEEEEEEGRGVDDDDKGEEVVVVEEDLGDIEEGKGVAHEEEEGNGAKAR